MTVCRRDLKRPADLGSSYAKAQRPAVRQGTTDRLLSIQKLVAQMAVGLNADLTQVPVSRQRRAQCACTEPDTVICTTLLPGSIATGAPSAAAPPRISDLAMAIMRGW